MVFLNICCLILYFVFAGFDFFFLYYFKVLPNYVPIRYNNNPLDFILDCLKVLSSDLQNLDSDTFDKSGIVIYEGMQGSGKTISMVHDVLMLRHRYPKSISIDNLGELKEIEKEKIRKKLSRKYSGDELERKIKEKLFQKGFFD